MLRIFLFAAMVLGSATAQAATWYVFSNVGKKDAIYFFDYDTVSKKGDEVTIWEKYVKKSDSPDSDGSYSTAMKLTFWCSNRKTQLLSLTIYDLNGQFMRTSSDPSKVMDVVPDSIGEAVLKTVCSRDFPQDKAGQNYIRVPKNDIYAFSKSYFEYMDAQQNDPAPH